MNNETMQLLYNRKSVRAYEKQPIPEADVQKRFRTGGRFGALPLKRRPPET